MEHIPVLLQEVIKYLDARSGKTIIDGTLNGGGHGREIARRILPSGKFVGVEWDKDLLESARGVMLKEFGRKGLSFFHANYRDIPEMARKGIVPRGDGIILDLGFSSRHMESGRGFTFQRDEPLDMRYDISSGKSASEIINGFREEDLADIIFQYGEERFSRRIASSIVATRRKKRIITSGELVEAIKRAVPASYRHGAISPATRTFQALRICVNGELDNLKGFLSGASDAMASKGRLVIISFHSLEDRIVKNFFREEKRLGEIKMLTKKPVVPSVGERRANPKSRSAKMRVCEFI